MAPGPRWRRRQLVQTVGAAAGVGSLAGCLGSFGGEGEYPSQDITIIDPFSAGGSFNRVALLVQEHGSKYLPDGVQFTVEQRQGAAGQVAARYTYDAEPDGYTMMIWHLPLFILHQLGGDTEFDMREMTMLAQASRSLRIFGVGDHTGIGSLEEFGEAVAAQELKLGSTDPQGTASFAVGGLGIVSGMYDPCDVIDNQVIYDQGNQAIGQALLSEEVDVWGGSYPQLKDFIDSGDVEIVMEFSFADTAPEWAWETLATAGYTGDTARRLSVATQVGRTFAGPPELPEDRSGYLRDVLMQTIQDEDFVAAAQEQGLPIDYRDADAVTEQVEAAFGAKELQDQVFENCG